MELEAEEGTFSVAMALLIYSRLCRLNGIVMRSSPRDIEDFYFGSSAS